MRDISQEILTEVYNYNRTPISFILLNKNIYKSFTNSRAKARWVLANFGKVHAFFHAIRLGKTFITVNVIEDLLDLGANLSRYLLQRFMLQNKLNIREIHPTTSWFSDMSLEVFIALLKKANERYRPNTCLSGDDAEKFSLLTGESLCIDQASIRIKRNLGEIRDLIEKNRFTPFPSNPRVIKVEGNIPARDDGELCMVARAIALEPSIAHMWKGIGCDIRKDVNDSVIQGCILKLLPQTPPINSNKKSVIDQLNTFIHYGFKLTKCVMVDLLCHYKNQPGICDFILMESFHEIRKESKFVTEQKCLIEITRVNRKIDYKVLDFLKRKGIPELEFLFLKTFIYHFFITEIKKEFDNLEIPYINNNNNHNHNSQTFTDMLNCYKNLLNVKIDNIKEPIDGKRTLTLKSDLYSWVLNHFNINSTNTKLCFHDIILSKMWVEAYPLHPKRNTITSIYNEYCRRHIPFEVIHLKILRKSNEETTLEPFFGIFLPKVFNIEPTFECEQVDGGQLEDMNPKKWINVLNYYNTFEGTAPSETFINLFNTFRKRINEETSFLDWLKEIDEL